MQTHIKRSGLTLEFKLWVDEIERYTKAIYFQRGGEEEEKYMFTFITAYPCPSICKCTRETPVLLCKSSSVSDMDCTDNDSLNQKWEYSVLDWTVG